MARKARRGTAILGALLLFGALAGLFINEWRTASRQSQLAEIGDQVQEVRPNNPSPSLEGFVVLARGSASVQTALSDPLFGIERKDLLLERQSQLYQWIEISEGSGQDASVSYRKIWSTKLIDSRRFQSPSRYANPEKMVIPHQVQIATDAKIGRLEITTGLLGHLEADQVIAPTSDKIETKGLALKSVGDWHYSGNPDAPEIGDYRIRNLSLPEQNLSMIARLEGVQLVDLIANGRSSGLGLIAPGIQDSDELIGQAATSDYLLGWLVRFFTLAGIIVGVGLSKPWITSTWPWSIKFLSGGRVTAGLLVGGFFWCIGLALAWVVHRPLWSVALLGGGLLLLFFVIRLGKQRGT